ncbi:L-serine ammonia-lyase, iron-sulfur-dependent, subunit alpha [Shigella flexneri]
MKNELALHSKEELEQHFANVWEVMRSGIERVITSEGVLPGKLRTASCSGAAPCVGEYRDKTTTAPMAVVEADGRCALAVNEENAAGGRVVTAPTDRGVRDCSRRSLASTTSLSVK